MLQVAQVAVWSEREKKNRNSVWAEGTIVER